MTIKTCAGLYSTWNSLITRTPGSQFYLLFTSLNSKHDSPQMACKIMMNSSNPPIVCRFSSIKPKIGSKTITLSSPSNNQEQRELVSTTTAAKTQVLKSTVYDVKFKTLGACKLGISRYPDFEYDAEGGLGTGSGSKVPDSDPLNDEISVSFDIKTLYIPPLTGATTRFLGLPLPPFLKIDIVPELFQGSIYPESGKVN